MQEDPGLRLPKSIESDPRAQKILYLLTSQTRQLWRESERWAPVCSVSPDLATALIRGHRAGRVVRSLENAERVLASEERGLRMADDQSGTSRGVRISRLLLLANDGAERFYRRIDSLSTRYGPRVLTIRLEIDERGLGELLYGAPHVARLLMVEHKEAVAEILLSLATQSKLAEELR